ncbi:MAG: Smr/MutS family protein [Myxococcota bacterium]
MTPGGDPPKPGGFEAELRRQEERSERAADTAEDAAEPGAPGSAEASAPLRLPPRRFVREDEGRGRAEDVPAKVLRQLRRGQPEPDGELDLHGLDARAAEEQVASYLLDAHHAGKRCVRVVHGRGRHSGRAVLRSALPDWLSQRELAGIVQAFARSPVERDGGGSTLVLLRRPARLR